jgi:hypothetical protein
MATANDGSSPPPVVPRRLSACHEPKHVRSRFADDRRPITRDRAEEAVAEGVVEGNAIDRDGRTWRYRHRVDGCDVVVAVADATEPFRDFVVLTAYVDVAEAGRAWAGDTWSKVDLHTAALLQYLKDAGKTVEEAGLRPKQIHVTDPVDYDGHRVINKQGYSLAVCVECGHESTDGDEYKRRSCR